LFEALDKQVGKGLKQAGQLAVEAQVSVFGLNGIGAELVAHVVGAAVAQRQEIGDAALAHLLLAQGFEGEIGGERVAEGRAADEVEVLGGRLRVLSVAGVFEGGRHRGGRAGSQRGQVVRKHWVGFALEGRLPGNVIGRAFGVVGQGQQGVPRLGQVAGGVVSGVELRDPVGQRGLVEGASDERPVGAVVPVGGRGRVARRQDAAPVLHAHANGFGLEVRGQPQLVGDGGAQQVARRHLARRHCAAHGLHGFVFGHVGVAAFLAHPPVVADDAVHGRCGAGVHAGVAGASVGGHVVVVTAFVTEAFVQQALEAPGLVLAPVAVDVVVAHLVDHNPDHQLRAWQGVFGFGRQRGQG
jgi:hypothetical protein